MNRTMSVAQLASYLKGVFDDEELLHDVTLTGEVAEISYSDKHTFLVVADGAYSVRCVHFSSRDRVEKGARVALTGSVAFYDRRASVSFIYRELRLCGAGEKNARLLELKQKLFALGFFENRLRLPKYILSVAAITSADGAAVRDLIRVVHDKNPFVSIKVYPVKVQGEGAAAQMTEAINRLQSFDTDAIVLCRGGGSDEDLDAFNDEGLATAVALSRIPVISAVGHEVDNTLCDFCAGTRAGTPSIAGEIINAHASAVTDDIVCAMLDIKRNVAARYEREVTRVGRYGKAAVYALSRRTDGCLHRLTLDAHRCMYAVKAKAAAGADSVGGIAVGLRSALSARLHAKRAEAERLMSILSALDPHRIIKVGYAAVLLGKTRVNGVAGLKAKDEISLVFGDGEATAMITSVKIGG